MKWLRRFLDHAFTEGTFRFYTHSWLDETSHIIRRAEVKTDPGARVWELWWRGEVIAASTNEQMIRDAAALINAGRN